MTMTPITDEETQVLSARDKYATIVKRRAAVRDQIDALQQAIAAGDERLVSLRAEQIMNGRTGDERYESLAGQLTSQREELRHAETELKALELAERQAAKAVQVAEDTAARQAANRLLSEMRHTARKLDGVLSQAEKLNDRLLELDAECRAAGLAEVGGKPLVLLSRSGSAWSALNPNHVGQTITLQGWRQHLRGILEE